MAQARQILARVSSVKSTQKITRAMKMVAAAKLNGAQARMQGVRPYSEGIAEIFGGLASNLFGDEHPLLQKRPEKRVLNVLIAGDRGLCGGFNNNVIRHAGEVAAKQKAAGIEPVFYAVGKRAILGARKFGYEAAKTWHGVFDKLSFILAGEIARQFLELYAAGPEKRIDAVNLIYSEFTSRLSQTPITKKLMPLDMAALAAERAKATENLTAEEREELPPRPVYCIEPDSRGAIRSLLQHRLGVEIYHAIIESYASELAARMAAMDSATNAAEEMIESLSLLYNRARQAGITSELIDIVSGASAVG